VDIAGIPGAADLDDIRTLFAESPSRFVVSVKKENATEFEKLMAGNPFAKAGQTNSTDRVVFKSKGNTIISMTCAEIASAWKREI
jgi:phosphoribosylformylglycinamidine synthase